MFRLSLTQRVSPLVAVIVHVGVCVVHRVVGIDVSIRHGHRSKTWQNRPVERRLFYRIQLLSKLTGRWTAKLSWKLLSILPHVVLGHEAQIRFHPIHVGIDLQKVISNDEIIVPDSWNLNFTFSPRAEQFHRVDLNWNWHSSMALAAPMRTESMKEGFFLQKLIWKRRHFWIF